MHSLGVVFNEQYNRFVIHSHLFSLENVDDVEKTKIFWKSGEISSKSSKSVPEIRRISIRRKVQKPGDS